ncbi:MAG: serine acetyltransferase [Micavibrio sp.]|nr:MAG: serine acetyltransferase [Micavibrio sp.]
MSGFIQSIQERDPACPTFFEVVFSYPGFHAIGFHKVSHFLWGLKLKGLARFWAHIGRFLTGIEIHPGANIGKHLFIDHGMGVVIGETTVIGEDVTLYHGVTLGGKGGDTAGSKRHPTLDDGSVIGSGAQVLGDVEIGKRAKVGANSVVTSDVPPGCTVVGNPARLIHCKESDQGKAYGMPRQLVDPVSEVIDGLLKDVKTLKEKAGVKEQDISEEEYSKHWKGSGI